MQQILEKKLPLREQFEILYVKSVLKPVIKRINERNEKEEEQPLSENEEDENGIDEIIDKPGESTAKGEKVNAGVENDTLQTSNDFQIALSFVFETILSTKPEDLALLFLLYDCQHFSENIVTKSFNLILNYSSEEPEKRNQVFRILF